MALNRPVTLNSTSNIVEIEAFDTATGKPKTGLTHATSGLVVYAALNNAAPASIGTLVTMTEGTWTTLGFKESTNNPGTYQIGATNTLFDDAVGKLKISARITSDDTVYFRPEVVDITTDDSYAAGLTAADVNAEVVDVIRTDTVAELTAPPAANAALSAKINWLFMKARNVITQTATTQLVKADDGTTTVGTSTVSDNGTTATRGEFS